MKVAIIEPIGGHGGMDYYDYGLALGLAQNGVFVKLYTSEETLIREYEGVETIPVFKKVWQSSFFIKVWKYFYGHLLAFKDAGKNGIQVLHLHFFGFRVIDLLILVSGRLFNCKIIATIHDINPFHQSSNTIIEKLCYKFIDGIIVHNQTSQNVLLGKKTAKRPLKVIAHGNYLPFISPGDGKEVKDTAFTLLFFGQIKEVKGLDVLLKAVQILVLREKPVKLIIAGKPYKQELNFYEDLIRELVISDYVECHFRYIPDEEVKNLYDRASLVVLPYKEIYQSGVLLLTMSYGKAVICSDLEPFKEVIKDNSTGFLFSSGSSENLADRIEELMGNSQLITQVKTKANNIITDKYDWGKIGLQTKQFYNSIIRVK